MREGRDRHRQKKLGYLLDGVVIPTYEPRQLTPLLELISVDNVYFLKHAESISGILRPFLQQLSCPLDVYLSWKGDRLKLLIEEPGFSCRRDALFEEHFPFSGAQISNSINVFELDAVVPVLG